VHESGTPVFRVLRSFQVTARHKSVVVRWQFPVRPATAGTFHHNEGLTLKRGAVNFREPKRFAKMAGRHYVSYSRFSNPEHNLFVPDPSTEEIHVDPRVHVEMARLRSESASLNKFNGLQRQYRIPDLIHIVIHNTRSLTAHIDDIRSDCNLLAADILVFIEARLKQSSLPERLQIQGLQNEFADCSSNVHPSNVVVYFKPHAGSMFKTSVWCVRESNFMVKYDIFAVSGLLDCLHMISIYRSPAPGSLVHFFQELEDALILFDRMRLTKRSPPIIFGDFNIDLLQPSNASRQECSFFSTRLLRQCVEYHTTDYGSLLDHVWTNLQPTQLGVFMQEAFWSDHVPVLLSQTLNAVVADACESSRAATADVALTSAGWSLHPGLAGLRLQCMIGQSRAYTRGLLSPADGWEREHA
jgi:hypothetical protein